MSAIFGIIDLLDRPLNPEWIKSMQTDLAHRGPDGHGLYREDSVALGHMLLQVTPESIYDKSPYEEDGFVITANARLDEREAIMDRLNIEKSEREKITDPLLLLRSYRIFGKDFVKEIYGDFSFAIWDKGKRELFCARDQMGVKPFLYYFQNNRFVFSTELKAVVELSVVKTQSDHDYLLREAVGMDTDFKRTAWTDIFRLQPATTLFIKDKQLQFRRFWSPTYKQNPLYKSEEDSAGALRALLIRVISDHTRTVGNVGVPLSGGLDSSTIACLAAKKLKTQNKTVVTASSVLDPGFSDPVFRDELEYIKSVLEQESNIEPGFIYHSDLSCTETLETKFNRHYSPPVHSHYVDDALNEHFQLRSVRRVLSGFLGDMTTSNKTIYPLVHLFIKGRPLAFFKLLNKLNAGMGLSKFKILKSYFLAPLLPVFIHDAWKRMRGKSVTNERECFPFDWDLKENKSFKKELTGDLRKNSKYPKNIPGNIWPTPDDCFQEDWDCGASYYSLEITYPLLDRRLIEFLLSVPVEHFNSGGRQRGLIRKAMEGIIPEKNRLRRDKHHYSPGFHLIYQKDFKKLYPLKMYSDRALNSSIKLDLKKLNNFMTDIGKYKNYSIFEGDYWGYINIVIGILFINWESGEKEISHKKTG